MFTCNCGKELKTEKGINKHILECPYASLNIEKIYKFGLIIDSVNRLLFRVAISKIKKYSKINNINIDDAKTILQKEEILKYRKNLYDILEVWQEELLPSEYRTFLNWVFLKYKNITLLSLRNTLSNRKIIYRFNLEHSAKMIGSRIEDSLLFVHEHKEFVNDFEFTDYILSGNISMYYVLFNDWLAQQWFGRIDIDLQHELEEYVEIASKTVLNRLNPDEFDLLNKLACTSTPMIYEF